MILTRAEKVEEEPKEPEEEPKEPEEDPIEEIFGLTELKIEGIELEPQFQTDVYEYKINVQDLEKLKITTLATEANSVIEILGNEALVEGENIITIHVKSENEEKNATYQLTVNKTIKEITATSNVVNETENIVETPKLTKENPNMITVALIAAVSIIAITTVAIIINARKNKSFYEEDEEEFESDEFENDEFEASSYSNQQTTSANDEFFEEVKKVKGKRFK